MLPTFTELGIPFPLFEAPAICAEGLYVGVGRCSLCGERNRHCFNLEQGAELIVPCRKCKAENGLLIDGRESARCHACAAKVRFPLFLTRKLRGCYACLRSGRFALPKDTELGLISWEQTIEGITHGAPNLAHPDFEMVPREGGWTGARLPQTVMLELLRTPTYETWQGERWLFCCARPMVFVGEWNRQDFAQHAPDGDGRRLYDQVVEDAAEGFWEQMQDVRSGVYVFRCGACSRLRAHWDID